MYGNFQDHLNNELKTIRDAGLFKSEREITSAQGAKIGVNSGDQVLNLCANNYLGLAQHPRVKAAAQGGWSSGVTGWPRFVLSAAPRVSINSWSRSSVHF